MLAMYLAMLETEADQRRFTRLYEAYEKTVYAVALRVLGNPTRAEDAAQQTWFQLLRRWERVSALPWGETEGYVFTAAKNCALDALRTERKTVAFPEDWDPPAREDREDEYAYLVSLIRSLPEGYRRILELKLVEEVTVRGIPAEFLTEVPSQTLTTTIGSGEDSTTVFLSGNPSSALLWTDPETGITFRLTGRLEKEDFLKIAENITENGG